MRHILHVGMSGESHRLIMLNYLLYTVHHYVPIVIICQVLLKQSTEEKKKVRGLEGELEVDECPSAFSL